MQSRSRCLVDSGFGAMDRSRPHSVYDGRGWWALDTLAGSPPPVLRESIVEHDGRALVPMTAQAAGVLAEMEPDRLSVAAARCLEYVERGEAPPRRGSHSVAVSPASGSRFRCCGTTMWRPRSSDCRERSETS